jgi:hypothetical protein
MAWGSAAEQTTKIREGNPDAKNWKEEALQIFETTVHSNPFLKYLPDLRHSGRALLEVCKHEQVKPVAVTVIAHSQV